MGKWFHRTAVILFICTCLIGVFAAGQLYGAAENTKQEAPKAAPAPKQDTEEPSFQIKMSVDLVTTDVSVIGTPASGLQPEDFQIFDNEISHEVSFFSQDQLPLAIALDVDASESIRPYLPMLQIAAYSTLRRLKPEDQVSLHIFNAGRWRLADLTEDRIEIAEKIGKIKIALGTNIYDSVYDAVSYLRAKAPRRRRAVILVSDNCHVIFSGEAYHGKDGVRSELLEANTLLYNIRTPGESGGFGGCYQSDAEIRRIAEDTGGMVINVEDPAGIQPALEKIIANLRKQYTLGFNPTESGDKGSFHKLAVKFSSKKTCPDCRILSRSGYYAGIASPLPNAEDTTNLKKKKVESPEKTDQILVQRSILAAGAFDRDLPGIKFNVKPTQQTDANGQPQVKLDLNIPAAGILFKDVESKHACKLRVVVFYAKENGKVLGSDWKKIEGFVGNDTYNRIVQNGYSYSVTIPMKDPTQLIKVVLFDEESDMIGTRVLIVQQAVPLN